MTIALPNRVEPSPMSPGMPAAWTLEIHAAAYEHACAAYPAEAAGIVEDGCYVPLDNLSKTPGEDVVLGEADLLRVADADVFFHSHPDGRACPSASDMVYQRQLGIPFVTMCLPIYDLFCHGDMLAPAPLIGRGFRHGVHDCYSLIRDFYVGHGITRLWDQPRAWEWWQQGQDLYRQNFAAAGFKAIAKDEAFRLGDVLLFQFHYGVPMHGALVHDRHLLLHHPAGTKPADPTRLSKLEPDIRLRRHVALALRHEDFHVA